MKTRFLSLAAVCLVSAAPAARTQQFSSERETPPPKVVFDLQFEHAAPDARDALATHTISRRSDLTSKPDAAEFRREDSPAVHRFDEARDIGAVLSGERSSGLSRNLRGVALETESGQEMLYVVGGRHPVPVLPDAASDARSGAPPTLPHQRFGLSLRLLPVLLDNGLIRVRVRAEVAAPDFGQATVRNGYIFPALGKRTVSSTIDVKPGQSFALTGLIDASEIRKLERTPGLEEGSSLLRSVLASKRSEAASSLVVVVTPRLAPPPAGGSARND